jgi:hypothetical protein
VTITIAWVRRNKGTAELVLASDSRLRSYGALDQAQKLFALERGDCCLGFCGDTQIAYPLFIQVGTSINNFVKTRTRALDVTDLADNVKGILNNLVASWDANKAEKAEQLADTQILFAGWSWVHKRFSIGAFRFENGAFAFRRGQTKIPYPWREKNRSLVFIGDYQERYMEVFAKVLQRRHGVPARTAKKEIDFDYEPIEALQGLLGENDRELAAIGGAAQMVKVYSYSNCLPIVVKTKPKGHYLLGRKLFSWEKTEYPILDLTTAPADFIYPMSYIPKPDDV